MNKSIKEQLEFFWPQDDVKPIDKNSTEYFMCDMTQKEFDDKNRGTSKFEYEFNKIKEPITKPTDFDFNASNAINPTQDRLKCDEVLNRG